MDNSIVVDFLNTSYTIDLPSCDIAPQDLNQGERLLLLHYLGSSGADAATVADAPDSLDRFASYESLPGGMFYFPTFKKRGPARLQQQLGTAPEKLLSACESLGATPSSFGDASIVIQALPLIDMAIVVDAEDDEFPAEVRFLFVKEIINYLPLEDIAVLGGTVATRITKVVSQAGR